MKIKHSSFFLLSLLIKHMHGISDGCCFDRQKRLLLKTAHDMAKTSMNVSMFLFSVERVQNMYLSQLHLLYKQPGLDVISNTQVRDVYKTTQIQLLDFLVHYLYLDILYNTCLHPEVRSSHVIINQ